MSTMVFGRRHSNGLFGRVFHRVESLLDNLAKNAAKNGDVVYFGL